MKRILISTLLVGATFLTVGCANSVLNDPEEMARRQAFVDRQQTGWNRFWGGGSGGGTAPNSGGSASTRTSPGLYQPGVTQSQCARSGGTWNTASGFCWRL